MTMRALVMIFAVAMFASPIRAGSSDFAGRWTQVRSTGGECPTCALAIAGEGRRFEVASSNGWTAEVSRTGPSDGAFAMGTGRWPTWGARPVLVYLFIQADGNLFVKMAIRHPDGSNQVVQAVFRRDVSV